LYRRPPDVIQLAVHVAESSRTRRLVGRLDPGTDLLSALTDLCRAHDVRAGALRATGTVADATVGTRRVDGNAEIVSLNARLGEAVEAWAALALPSGELVGGRRGAARVVACDFVVDTFDDLPAKKAVTFEVPARTSWSDVVAASEGRKNDPPPAPAVRPASNFHAVADTSSAPPAEPINVRPGDFIDHPKFGRCAVERVDGDYEFVTARLRNQRLIRLSLDVLTLIHAGEEDGKNVFRAVAGA
jgi:predicted DNA-binding protein with PD1-like motif